jgi:hypothetical protein
MTLIEFALSYNGYLRQDDVVTVGRDIHRQWIRDQSLPSDLRTLRCALFFRQRAWRHAEDRQGVPFTSPYVRALVGRIAELSSGSLPGPADPMP